MIKRLSSRVPNNGYSKKFSLLRRWFATLQHVKAKLCKCNKFPFHFVFCEIYSKLNTLIFFIYGFRLMFYFSSRKRLQPAILLKVTLLHGRFSRFLNCCKWYQIAQSITYIRVGMCCVIAICFLKLS